MALRLPVEADREEYIALRRRSRAFLEPWDSTPPGTRRGWNYAAAAFDRALATSRLESSLRLLVRRREDDAVMGAVGITNIVRGAFQSCTIGYWIGLEFSRRGYMTDALALTLHTCFRTLGLHRVEANIMPSNRASTALVARLGFREEGLARRYLRINDRWRDHVRWGMTIEDYRGLCRIGVIPYSRTRRLPITL